MEQIQGLKSGTTTVGLICRDSVILAAEKRSLLGSMVASEEEVKIVEIMPHIAMTHAGVCGDLQALTRYMRAEAKLFELKNKRKISVKAAATLLANILYGRRSTFFPYLVQIIMGGFDDGPKLFILHSDGSTIEEKKFFATGSGSPMAFGVLETLFREGISTEEGKRIALKAVKAATERDTASGGRGIDLAIIDKTGFKLLEKEEVERILQSLKK